MIFDALSNAAYRVPLRGPGAEIEGGVLNNPPPAGGGKSRGPAGRGLTLQNHGRAQQRDLRGCCSDRNPAGAPHPPGESPVVEGRARAPQPPTAGGAVESGSVWKLWLITYAGWRTDRAMNEVAGAALPVTAQAAALFSTEANGTGSRVAI